jgi:hypothetical protein
MTTQPTVNIAEDWFGEESVDLTEVLRDALDDVYADADPEEMEDALADVLESMSPAEAFNFAKAMRTIGRSASQVVTDPMFSQVVGTALPIAGGAVGTVVGGPAGTALGSKLGTVVAGAIPGKSPARTAVATPAPAVAGGSAAATQALILTEQPDVKEVLLKLALGQQAQQSVNGVPVAKLMNMLRSVFGQAAADADELMYLQSDRCCGDDSDEFLDEESASSDRSIYTTLLDADNYEIAEALESL